MEMSGIPYSVSVDRAVVTATMPAIASFLTDLASFSCVAMDCWASFLAMNNFFERRELLQVMRAIIDKSAENQM